MNLQYEQIRRSCEDLKLGAIAAEWTAIADRAVAEDQSLADFLEALFKIEVCARTDRTQSALLKFAGLPVVKRFEGYDFNFATGAPKKQLQGFLSLSFVERKENIVFLGPSGVGKSHLAISSFIRQLLTASKPASLRLQL